MLVVYPAALLPELMAERYTLGIGTIPVGEAFTHKSPNQTIGKADSKGGILQRDEKIRPER